MKETKMDSGTRHLLNDRIRTAIKNLRENGYEVNENLHMEAFDLMTYDSDIESLVDRYDISLEQVVTELKNVLEV